MLPLVPLPPPVFELEPPPISVPASLTLPELPEVLPSAEQVRFAWQSVAPKRSLRHQLGYAAVAVFIPRDVRHGPHYRYGKNYLISSSLVA